MGSWAQDEEREWRRTGGVEMSRCGCEGPAKGRLSWAPSHSPALHGSLQEPPFPRGLA